MKTYIITFALAVMFFTALFSVALLAVVGVLCFITWSLPVATINYWLLFRLLLSLAVVWSTIFMFSPEGKAAHNDTKKRLNKL